MFHDTLCAICHKRPVGARYIPGVGEFLACRACDARLCEVCAVLLEQYGEVIPLCPRHAGAGAAVLAQPIA